MSYVQRQIDLTFTLASNLDTGLLPAAQPVFAGSGGANTITLTGLRVAANIVKAGGKAMGELQMRVFGMTLSQMNQLSTLGFLPSQPRKNSVTVKAGNVGGPLTVVFDGNITDAWIDFQGAPDVAFIVSAYEGYNERIKSADPSSYSGSVDVNNVLQDLATQAGYKFENNGVSVQLDNPYLPGTVGDQIEEVCQQAGIAKIIDNGVLSVWPSNGSRKQSSSQPIISASTGMVGYPSFNPLGVSVSTEFNPALKHGIFIQVQSIVQPANGTWQINMLNHELAADLPGGPWFSHMECVAKGYLPSDE